MRTDQPIVKRHQAILAYIIMATFLCFEMALQVSPGVMTQQLMRDLHIDEAGLGFMSGAYFYTYAAMQIPAGLLFARYNLRYVVAIALVFCVSGVTLFAVADHLWVGTLARILMGTGSAFGFVSVLVVASQYFNAKLFALLAGVAQLIGALGAICGVAPLSAFINLVGWRETLISLAAFGLLLIIVVLICVPLNNDFRKTQQGNKKTGIIRGLLNILRFKQNWIVAIYSFFSWAPITAFASLWGVPYLTTAYHLTTTAASAMIALIWIGVALGSPAAGAISERIASRRNPLFTAALVGFLSSTVVIYFHLNILLLIGLLFVMGIGSSGQALSFAVVKDNNSHYESVALGFNNMAVVITGGVVQPIIGFLISAMEHITATNSMLLNYKLSLWIVPLSFLLCAILSKTLIRESYPREITKQQAILEKIEVKDGCNKFA